MKVLKKFEFPVSDQANSAYDWATLFDGQIREMEHKVDFQSTPENFASTSRWVGAYKFRKVIKTHVKKNAEGEPTGVVIIQALPMTDLLVAEYDAKCERRDAERKAKSAARKAGRTTASNGTPTEDQPTQQELNETQDEILAQHEHETASAIR